MNRKSEASKRRPPPPADAGSFLEGKCILVTGGTGSFGRACVRRLLRTGAKRVVVFSRDELKQHEMSGELSGHSERLRFFIGDVRDKQRLLRAFSGVDFVVHAAALKQVPALEYNPFEAVLTNVIGSQNIVDAAIDSGVQRVLALSTDKAANPINLYGATKLCSEKLFVAGNSYAAQRRARFSVVRYGNVIGSRGSVIPFFREKRKEGVLPITDERMTRFWLTLEQGVDFVLSCLAAMHGGEIFVPKIPSMRVVDLAKAMAPECRLKTVGIRPGEKVHETLLTEDEAARTLDLGSFFVIQPLFPWWGGNGCWPGGRPLPGGYRYTSDTNTDWIDAAGLKALATSA